MVKKKILIAVVLVALMVVTCSFVCDDRIKNHYEKSLPAVPDQLSGRIHPLHVGNGLHYGTEKEIKDYRNGLRWCNWTFLGSMFVVMFSLRKISEGKPRDFGREHQERFREFR